MQRVLIIGVLAAVLVASLAAPRTARAQASATTAAAGMSLALTSGAQIDAYLTLANFHGFVYLERHGHVILSKGYGLADTQAHVPNTIRSRWPDIGTNRFITALAILKLQDEHKLSVRDKLCRYLTGCPSRWRSLTIHELLLDTSGLGTFDTTATPGGVVQALDRCKALPLTAAPGTVTPESRCNNLLLNSIIVTVMGRPWAAAMQTLLFGPAHMTNSGLLTNAVTPPERVQGYSAGAPVLLGNYNNYYAPYSSVEDLVRMDRALLTGHLISRTALHALFTPYLGGVAVLQRYLGSNATDLSSGYECYLHPATRTTVTVADKPGDVGGFLFDDALSPDDGSIAIMAQNDDSAGTAAPTDLFFGLAPKLLWGQ